ncbi:30S ribosomal protein S2 [Patescibacteria group bacterium]|nr:30S ribosomal protein S2 [Patescibacteria group bacterium]MBU4023243.1 30S ribosomal protein S2 [Patescibacteria group bacterium]MBU4078518.1 30S ribosomal protein S2 [Patescibacteria group bacterium]
MVEKKKTKDFGISIEEMAKAGVNFGHRISKCHPNMKPFAAGVKGSDHINMIDLEKTKEYFVKMLEVLEDLMKQGKTILFVGTKLPIRKLVEETAKECEMPYIINRWIGGTITNFGIIKKRLEHFKDLENKKESGELDKYTKKERLEFDRELERLDQKFGGIKKIEKLPDALFAIDMRKDELAIREAKAKGIPVFAIADTEVNPDKVDYFIPANDDAISSVKYILEKVKQVILKNK